MDPNTAVIVNVVVALVGFAGVVVALMLLITRWKWHVFLALLLPLHATPLPMDRAQRQPDFPLPAAPRSVHARPSRRRDLRTAQ
jgi:hypothetical protein